MSLLGIALVAVLIVVWCTFSRPLGRADITPPMAFAAAGLLLGGPALLDVRLTSEAIKVIAEVTLVLVLFSDAARLDLSSLRRDIAIPARLLGIGLPLTLLAGALAVRAVFGDVGLWPALLVAACLAPTDASLGAGIVSDGRVPSRVRRALNVESGLNDGIVAPLVTVAIAAVVGGSGHGSSLVPTAVRELSVGAVVGVAVGLVGGWVLATATRRGWVEPGADVLASTALAAVAYTAALGVHGNGFVAAFAAGLCFGPFRSELEPASLELTDRAAQLAGAVVWFAFGAAMLRPALTHLSWQVVLYAVLSLTVVRMVPVALSLLGARLDRVTIGFVGWFGPRGLASVIFALLAFDDAGQRSGEVVALVSITVLMSVVAHGVSAAPLIARYERHVRALSADDPVRLDVPVPPPRRTLGTHHRHPRTG